MSNTAPKAAKPAPAPKAAIDPAEFESLKKRVSALERANEGRRMIRGDD
ncbi:hypothetical protein GG804_24990 [Sphingomonas histidinilytica]|nr:hypothetical protein [Rhizorhabdus histidinilytica]MBO9380028.1 hypothetical protein [Rhizorhabdus histidinilytica]